MSDPWLEVEGTVESIIYDVALFRFRELDNPRDGDAADLIDQIYGALGFVESERKFDRDFVPAVERAYNRLRLLGYRCEQNWQFTITSGWDAIPWEDADHAVWYHGQDRDNGIRSGSLFLVWTGDPVVIREALEAEGLAVEHDGSHEQRMSISLAETAASGAAAT